MKIMAIIHFLQIKKRAVFKPRAGHFRRLVGFEAKAKDLKMCPQGRPRGLHLCKYLSILLSMPPPESRSSHQKVCQRIIA